MSVVRIGQAVATAAALVTLVTGVPQAHAADGVWDKPGCARVAGPSGAVTYTTDDGATIRPTMSTMSPVTEVHALAALDTRNTLVAVEEGPRGNIVLRSNDAGCTWWRTGSPLEGGFFDVAVARGGRAYLWPTGGNGDNLYQVNGTRVTRLSFSFDAVGLAVDPANADHLRLLTQSGQLQDSLDAGRSWRAVGSLIDGGPLVNHAAFDPADLDHVVAGTSGAGAYVTADGGRTWVASTGLASTDKGQIHMFNLAVSPVDHDVVYATGLDYPQQLAGHPSEGRHIYRSTDGGRSYTPVVDKRQGDTQEDDIVLSNGTRLSLSPTDPGVLYFSFGTHWLNRGTDLYRYSAGTGKVTKTHNNYDSIHSIAFNPTHPDVLYLGLGLEPDSAR